MMTGILLFPFILNSQANNQVRFTNFNSIEGFPAQEIFAIAKDAQGFFWIGSTDGLFRFDGANSIQQFKANDPQIIDGLQSNDIKSICIDHNNTIWIGTTLGGLTKYDLQTDTWETYKTDTDNKNSISSNEILTIVEDSKNRIWIGTEDGLNLYNSKTNDFVQFLPDPEDSKSISAPAIISILEDYNDRLWVTAWDGGINLLMAPDDQNMSQSTFRHFYPDESKASHNVWKLYQDKNNRIWVGTIGAGLYLMDIPNGASNQENTQDWKPTFYNIKQDKNNPASISSNVIFDIYGCSQGYLWIASNTGLDRASIEDLVLNESTLDENYLIESLAFEHCQAIESDSRTINPGNIYHIYEDNQEMLWFGTSNGVSQYNWYANQFKNWKVLASSFKESVILDIYAEDEEIWIATDRAGLLIYNLETKKLNPFTSKNNKSLLDLELYCLYSDTGKKLYVGTQDGIEVIDLSTMYSKVIRVPSWLKKEISHFEITSICKDHYGNLWVGTSVGLMRIDEVTGAYYTYYHDPSDDNTISDNSITSILEDSYGKLWVCTYNGINRTDTKEIDSLTFQRYMHNPDDIENSPINNQIGPVLEAGGFLYIGSRRGLFAFDFANDRFIDLNKSNGRYRVASLEKSKDGKIWGSTMNGIFKHDPKDMSMQIFDSKDELGGFIYSIGASGINNIGDLYFASTTGITKFTPADITRNETPPKVSITRIKKIGSEKESVTLDPQSKTLELDASDYYLTIEFAAFNYIQSNKNQYAYKLDGFEENWNYSQDKLVATYTNLEHGTYTFMVKGANNDGIWNDEITKLIIHKKAKLIETFWFQILSAILTLFLIVFCIQYYTYKVRRQNAELQKRKVYMEELVKKRTSELEIKNAEISSLLDNISMRNDELEGTVEQRTSELLEYIEELQRSNYDLEQFAYVASHDLQTPLQTINNFSSLLKRNLSGRLSEQEEIFVDFINKSVKNMQNLVRSLLSYSQANANKISISSVNPTQLIATLSKELTAVLDNYKAKIVYKNLPENIFADEIKFKQILQNLISNGIKFSKKGVAPIISINIEETNKHWIVEVSDNGIGINEKYQSRIFQIFQRLHTADEYEGTGIGLALCKKMVEQHDGTIWLESELGEGTSFFFTLSRSLAHKKVSSENKLKVV